ncbi:DNA-protecting protein DprA [Alkaliphilus serpentinus]|uniref:DNA-protecting protein DprA n=2 Tax=Alkaliphilus serpentinus TaxID=1482731 RepID=A0A833HQF9_9FIRM|nr:DNA-protecting protein DprA [Alkaliphilus serpentinus]
MGLTDFKHINLLYDYFGSLQDFWYGKDEYIKEAFSNNSIIAEKLIKNRNETYLQEITSKLTELQIKTLTIADDGYPEKLKRIYDPPQVIYIKGRSELNLPTIAIVGSRKATAYGRWAAYNLARELSQWGISIVSGLASGIDSEGHRGALEEKGYTIGVLGFGIDQCYPASNRGLLEEIHEKGCIISEYPPGRQPQKYYFPARNRIISGLSDGVLVIEAAEKSGALITVDFALDQGKDIYALPGNINSGQSKGTNRLIRDGAKIVLEAEDIIQDLTRIYPLENKVDNDMREEILSEDEMIVYNIIKEEPIHIDLILYNSKLDIKRLNGILSILELKGLITQLSGKRFTVAK